MWEQCDNILHQHENMFRLDFGRLPRAVKKKQAMETLVTLSSFCRIRSLPCLHTNKQCWVESGSGFSWFFASRNYTPWNWHNHITSKTDGSYTLRCHVGSLKCAGWISSPKYSANINISLEFQNILGLGYEFFSHPKRLSHRLANTGSTWTFVMGSWSFFFHLGNPHWNWNMQI